MRHNTAFFRAAICAAAATMALATSPWSAGGAVAAEPAKPGAGLPSIPVSPVPAATCANQGYQCPAQATCNVLSPVPSGQALLGLNAFDAHRCTFVPVIGSPTGSGCPDGLVKKWVTPRGGGDGIAAATWVCAPPDDACTHTKPGWVRATPVMQLTPPQLGYTCRWRKAG